MGPTGGVDQSLTAAGLRRLRDFREEVLCCLGRRRDALFELVDALLAAESLPHLSLLPVHRWSWGSVYAALAVGEVDGTVPLCVFDAGYDPIALTVDLADVAVAVLVRIRSDRVFYAAPTARVVGQLGRPRRHGTRFLCADPTSWPAPDQTLEVNDEQYGRVQVACWAGLHPSWPVAAGGPTARGCRSCPAR